MAIDLDEAKELWYRNQEIENLRNEEEKKGFAAHN
jgi:hypothetical protein